LTCIQAIQTYFNGLLSEYYALVPDEAALSKAARNVTYQSSLHKALITCGFAVGDETHYRGIWIPAPDLANYELVSGVGYRMTQAAGAAFLTALNAVSDTTHTFRQGVLEFREGRQAKPGAGGYLEMQDYNGRKCYMKVPDVSVIADLATFADVINNGVDTGFSTAAITKAVVLTQAGGVVSGTPTEESGYDSVALRAKLRFSWPVSGKLRYMTLNAPTLKSTSLETASGSDAKKRAVTQACGDAIAAALTTLYGSGVRNLSFVDGYSDVVNIG
jgi:hypothetical protein